MLSTSEKSGLVLLRCFSLSSPKLTLLALPAFPLKGSLLIVCWLLSSIASQDSIQDDRPVTKQLK